VRLAGASRLVAYFKSHARKVYAALDADPRLAAADRLRRWLIEHPAVSRFTRRDLYQRLRRAFRQSADLEAPLELLVDLHYLHRLPGEPARREATCWVVNPLWARSAG
jgi:hypothetical protein